MDKHFFSVEFTDEDGYQVIEHIFMTDMEAESLINKFIEKGVLVSINKLSKLSSDTDDVSFDDVERLLGLGKPDKRVN